MDHKSLSAVVYLLDFLMTCMCTCEQTYTRRNVGWSTRVASSPWRSDWSRSSLEEEVEKKEEREDERDEGGERGSGKGRRRERKRRMN